MPTIWRHANKAAPTATAATHPTTPIHKRTMAAECTPRAPDVAAHCGVVAFDVREAGTGGLLPRQSEQVTRATQMSPGGGGKLFIVLAVVATLS